MNPNEMLAEIERRDEIINWQDGEIERLRAVNKELFEALYDLVGNLDCSIAINDIGEDLLDKARDVVIKASSKEME